MEDIQFQLSEIDYIAKKIISDYHSIKIFLFKGNLGMGKTTFIKSICKSLNINTQVSSPSFGIVNEYENEFSKVYHFDLYRIKSLQELIEIGFFEYLDSKQYCFIEWPEIIMPYLSDYDVKLIEFKLIANDIRSLCVSGL